MKGRCTSDVDDMGSWENYMPAARMALYQQGIEFAFPFIVLILVAKRGKTPLTTHLLQNLHSTQRRRPPRMDSNHATHSKRRPLLRRLR